MILYDIDPKMTAEKLTNMGRLIILMMIDRASRSKILVDLHLMMKRGKIAAKSLGELMIRHHHTYSALTCRSHDVHLSAVRPRDYEFSCSSSPAAAIPLHFGKSRKRSSYHHDHNHRPPPHPDVSAERVVKWLGCGDSPLGGLVRGLYEGSPAPNGDSKGLEASNEAAHGAAGGGKAVAAAGWGVDMAAEEFIERFYRELRLQKVDVNKKLRY